MCFRNNGTKFFSNFQKAYICNFYAMVSVSTDIHIHNHFNTRMRIVTLF